MRPTHAQSDDIHHTKVQPQTVSPYQVLSKSYGEVEVCLEVEVCDSFDSDAYYGYTPYVGVAASVVI